MQYNIICTTTLNLTKQKRNHQKDVNQEARIQEKPQQRISKKVK